MRNLLFAAIAALGVASCTTKQAASDFIAENIQYADSQVWNQIQLIEAAGMLPDGRWLNPRTLEGPEKTIQYIPIDDWTSGFFPGSVWMMYDLTKDAKYLSPAKRYTEMLDSIKLLKWHHDVGFMVETSFGNAYKLTGDSAYIPVLVEAAKSLATRFRPGAGIIQSWDIAGWQATRGWECPVIIDNMMNLELLFNATRFTGDPIYREIAISHADKTMAHQFRPDGSCYHVIDYSLKDGVVRHKQTAQGLAHESAWARGLGWAIYGYTTCYRYTQNLVYLEQAKKTFDYFWNHPNMPTDKVPLWDYQAAEYPTSKDAAFDNWRNKDLDKTYDIKALRDASAAAVVASALYELSTYELPQYKAYADTIMASLASPAYRAKVGTNGNFILQHSVGSIPHEAEIDVPLNYADYYFLEALTRKRDLEKK